MSQDYSIPHETYLQLFFRFLKFGLLAWGGPVAQIAMIRQELVDEERWISSARFNRVLSVYQVLPGPEAHELCVYFGMIARGRIGGLLAGLGFMLPGFILMFALSWFYLSFGINSFMFAGVFYGFQAAVGALIVRAVYRIGSHALHNRWLWGIAILSFAGTVLQVNFLFVLFVSGLVFAAVHRKNFPGSVMMIVIPISSVTLSAAAPTLLGLFGYGLRTGLLTFGGAYTAIPFLQQDAVVAGAWMTNQQFLDGLALSSILPAPLIIFSTFVGYLGGGPLGAVALTAGVFLPAFAFTLIGHDFFERLVDNQQIHAFLDGVTASVVGIIAATAIHLLQTALPDLPAVGIFILALFVLSRWRTKAAIAGIMLGAGLLGLLLRML